MTIPQDDQGLIIPWDDSGNGIDFQLPETYEFDDMPMITFDDLPGEAVGVNLDPWLELDPVSPSWMPQAMYTDPMLPQNQDLIQQSAPTDTVYTQTLNIDPLASTPSIDAAIPPAPIQEQVASVAPQTLNIDPLASTPSIDAATPPAPIQEQVASAAPQTPTAPQPTLQTAASVWLPTPTPTTSPISPNIPPMTTTVQEPVSQQTPNLPAEDNDDDITLSFLDDTIDVSAPQTSQWADTPAMQESSPQTPLQSQPEPQNTPTPPASLDRTSILDETIARMNERKENINTIKWGKSDEVAALEEEIQALKTTVASLKWEIAELEEEDKGIDDNIQTLENMKNLMATGKTTQALKQSVEEEKAAKTSKK